MRFACTLLLLSLAGWAQPELQFQRLAPPRHLDLSPDGSRLRYQMGTEWWEVPTTTGVTPKRSAHPDPAANRGAAALMPVTRRSDDVTSPDGKSMAYLGAERPYGPTLLFAGSTEHGAAARPVCRMPVEAFHWATDSKSLWAIAYDGADQPVGRVRLDGRFERISKGPAMRIASGLAAAGDVLAWTESDGAHAGSIWIRDRAGEVRMLFDPNPHADRFNPGTQEVIRWKNAHGEELQGMLLAPAKGDHLPLIVDPYSSMPNRYFNAAYFGNYLFVKEGFAVFYPDHRAPHGFPENAMGEAYVGAAKDRDPIDVLVDDVMSGVNDLIRRGIADPSRLYLYSSSTGATSIGQLLAETHVFRAGLAHGGVYDWVAHYEMRHPLGDNVVAGFLRGRTPADSMDLYRRISPFYVADRIRTPLLLVLGEKDETRVEDTHRFYDALMKAGSPAKLVVYPGEAHQLTSAAGGVKHVHLALDFFRDAPPAK